MPFNFGEVVLVRFPFTDQKSFKQRPAVIVSSHAYNLQRPDVVIMAITSQIRPVPGVADVLLREWNAANLLKPSAIKPVFATVEQGLVLRTLGVLQPSDETAPRQAMQTVLG